MAEVFTYLLIILVGVTFGSFVGAFTYRIPRGLDFVFGRSFCDSCKQPLGWQLNIPILSYLLRKGQTACCKKRIGVRYPLVELASGLTAVYLFTNFSFIQFVVFFAIFLIGLSILIIDLEHQYIEDFLIWPIFGLALIFGSQNVFGAAFSGLLVSSILLFLHLITKGRGMGLGDVKLAIAFGAWFGVYESIYWLFGAFLTGGIVAFILLLSGKAGMKQKIAFGPFLVISFFYFLYIKNAI